MPTTSDAFRATAARAQRVVVSINSQPSWVARAALTVLAMVFVATLFVLLVPAILAALVVFVVLSSANSVRRWFRGERSPSSRLSGRKNVRVIVRDR